MNKKLKILILEDFAPDAELMVDELLNSRLNFSYVRVDTKKDFLYQLQNFKPDLILCDYSLPTITGMEALELIKKRFSKIPLIIVTGSINEETAVACIKNGAADYVLKDNLTRLGSAIETTMENCRLKEEKERADEQVKKLSQVVTQSPVSIVITDLNGTIEYVNLKFSQITGYSAEEVIGQNPRLLKSGEQPTHYYKMLWDTISNGKIWRGEFHNKKKNGELFWEEAVISPVLSDQNKIINYIALKTDITDRKKAEEELRKSREQLRQLSAHLQSAAERERTKIAREVHDDLGQALTALKIDISNLRDSEPSLAVKYKDKITKMLELSDTIIKSVKRISSELRPSIIDDLGLPSAVEWHIDEFQRRTGIKCYLTIEPEEMDLDEPVSIALYRIIQEALTNVVRHAKAQKVEIKLLKTDTELKLSIADDGIGMNFSQLHNSRSLGLLGMKERARALQGSIQFNGNTNTGTQILVTVPIQSERGV